VPPRLAPLWRRPPTGAAARTGAPAHCRASRTPYLPARLPFPRPQLANEDGWTPLHLAARAGAAEKVKLLLEAGADAVAKTKQGHTPLALVRR
jgi:hypothetical protein